MRRTGGWGCCAPCAARKARCSSMLETNQAGCLKPRRLHPPPLPAHLDKVPAQVSAVAAGRVRLEPGEERVRRRPVDVHLGKQVEASLCGWSGGGVLVWVWVGAHGRKLGHAAWTKPGRKACQSGVPALLGCAPRPCRTPGPARLAPRPTHLVPLPRKRLDHVGAARLLAAKLRAGATSSRIQARDEALPAQSAGVRRCPPGTPPHLVAGEGQHVQALRPVAGVQVH